MRPNKGTNLVATVSCAVYAMIQLLTKSAPWLIQGLLAACVVYWLVYSYRYWKEGK